MKSDVVVMEQEEFDQWYAETESENDTTATNNTTTNASTTTNAPIQTTLLDGPVTARQLAATIRQ